MMTTKRLLALVLALVMALSMVACAPATETPEVETPEVETPEVETPEVETPEVSADQDPMQYLNFESELPIVKEGFEKTLRLGVLVDASQTNFEEKWCTKFIEEKMNINVEIIPFTAANREEYMSLAFGGNDLPDVIMGGAFTGAELVRYGQNEKQLTNIAPYINETYMPNLTKFWTENPSYDDLATQPDGGIYSLSQYGKFGGGGSVTRAYLNYDWLEELGLAVPETVDEFLDAMRAIKAAGFCEYPIGGSSVSNDPSRIFLNAIGYRSNTYDYTEMQLRNGKAVLPMADREAFGEYLRLMNLCFEEGLISPDFYSMDQVASDALLSADVGCLVQAPMTYSADPTQYWNFIPLKSELDPTQEWTLSVVLGVGGVVVTSACTEPELACKFIDFFYTDDPFSGYHFFYNGPYVGQENYEEMTLGLTKGWDQDEEGKTVRLDMEENPDKWANWIEWIFDVMGVYNNWYFGLTAYEWSEKSPSPQKDPWWLAQDEEELIANRDQFSGSDLHYGSMVMLGKYVDRDAPVWPAVVYMPEDQIVALGDTLVAMEEYALHEIALFITGEKDLTEENLNAYFDTMDSLGAAEYVQAYSDYYEAQK